MTKKIVLKIALCLLTGLLNSPMQGANPKQQKSSIVWNWLSQTYNTVYADYNRALACKQFVYDEYEKMSSRIAAKWHELAGKFASNQSTASGSWETYKIFLKQEQQTLIDRVKERYPAADNGSYTKKVIANTETILNQNIADIYKLRDRFISYLESQKAWYQHVPTIVSYICGFFGGFLNTVIKKSQLSQTIPQGTGNYLTGVTAIFLGTQSWHRNPTSPTTHCLRTIQASAAGHVLGWLCAKGLYKAFGPVKCSR